MHCSSGLQRKLESVMSDLQRQNDKFKEKIAQLSNKVCSFICVCASSHMVTRECSGGMGAVE